jgi:hypothetical protein
MAQACNPEAEIRKIVDSSQLRQTVPETISQTLQKKKGWWSVSRCRPWVQTPLPQKRKI